MLPSLATRASAWLIGLLLLGVLEGAIGRELAVDVEEMVEVEVATIGMERHTGLPVVLLREPGANEVITIFVGAAEAEAILRSLHGVRPRRPLTHDLLSSVLEGTEMRLERVYVDALEANTFLGMLELRIAGRDAPVRIDSRPSDAIALALQAGASVHVAPQVMAAAQHIEFEGLDDQVLTALGITVAPVTEDLRDALQLPDREGVLITDVSGPAEQAGMQPGALLLEVNERTPLTPMQFLESVRATPRGEKARLRYWQQGGEQQLELPTDVPAPRQRRPVQEPPASRDEMV
ncbi:MULTISPECIES: bifunctional nuclease domain-containing protein [Halomonadaceae]|uniref:bifunctional nuclease domain-containing protein n=1 Tax=Halomonadaceae TaxID=28256 RepID=UPI001598A48F|nr:MULTISPECIES: bifunctional nuclease domain-containing protein [Halomonas]QJQ95101.1 hypothetical protein HIO72_07330 [Halomonas sp. PA5]